MSQAMAALNMLCGRFVTETMEERILHSADLAPSLGDAAVQTTLQHTLPAEATRASHVASEIVFVDASVPDLDSLLGDLHAQRGAGRNMDVVVIAANQDGLLVIGQTLAERTGIASIHLLSHGSAGALQMGTSTLDAHTLMRNAEQIAAWGDALRPGADLLIYGCDFAQTEEGRQVVRDLATLTGADVAASTDRTGAAEREANWNLEYQTGLVDTLVAPSLIEQARWNGVLATFTVTATGDLGTLGALIPGTLRWAISQANANPGADTIVFAVNQVNLSSLSAGDDSNNAGDLDITGSVDIVGNGSGTTVITGGGLDRVLDVRASNVAISGVTIQGGRSDTGAGIRVTNAATLTLSDVVVRDNVGSGTGKGAGIYTDGTLVLRNVVVRDNGNQSTGRTEGAGIFVDDHASLDALNVEIRDNVADSKDGGGLHVKPNASVTLVNTTLAGNQARDGGGIFNKSAGTSLFNVTLSGNTATSDGGGLWSDRAATLDHVTVAGNSAASGGGVFAQSSAGNSIKATNSLFVGNIGGNTNGKLQSLGYNLSTDASGGFGAVGDRVRSDVALLALANNGGFVRTHALDVGSAAIDGANPAVTQGADARGIPYAGGRADIGAYERNPGGSVPTISGIANQTINEDAGLGPLGFTVSDQETAASALTVTVTSSNQALISNAALVLGGAGANRTLSLTSVPNANSANAGGGSTITVTVSDGFSSTSTSFLVQVLAVNDAPTLALPGSTSVMEDNTLTFSGGNAPQVDDEDVAGGALQVSLAVAHGLLTLSQTAGLSFVVGVGSANAAMTFTGSKNAINAALNGLRYTPDADYAGATAIQISVDDLGNSGAGGAQTASGSIAITVLAVNDAPTLDVPGPQVTPQPLPLGFSNSRGNSITVSDADAGNAPLRLTLTTVNAAGNGILSFSADPGAARVAGNWTGDTTLVVQGTVADLNALLQTLIFNATAPGAARIDIVADDLGNSGSGGAGSTAAGVSITVSNEAAPVLAMGQTSLLFVENSAPMALDPGVGVSDADHAQLASARIRFLSGFAGAEDTLGFVNDGVTMGNIAVDSYSNGVLVLVSAGQSASVAQWQAALRAVTYVNGSDSPSVAQRIVGLTVNDGLADSAEVMLQIDVAAVNDAPVLAGGNDLRGIDEDSLQNLGTRVSELIAGHVSDADANAMSGIAVIAADGAHGQWQFTVDGGTSWTVMGAVSDASALLLDSVAGTRLRFVPSQDWNGTLAPAVQFRAWDQTTGTSGASADARIHGGTSAFSSAAASANLVVAPVNDAPVLAQPIPGTSASEDSAFVHTLPPASFNDVDGDALMYTAALFDGTALPSWLNFDASTQTFSGTPSQADVGLLRIRITATDASGLSAFGDIDINVLNVNDAPVLNLPLDDQNATQDNAFVYALHPETFADEDFGDSLTLTATLSNGAALPSWLQFNAYTLTFSGTPGAGDLGAITVRVVATDTSGASAFDDFTITTAYVNAPPTLAAPVADQTAMQGNVFRLTVPPGTFTDNNPGDVLSYTATLPDGTALPGWLRFDAATRTFLGTPGNADVGSFVVRLTVTDGSQASAVDEFRITVADVNDAPAAVVSIADQSASQDAAFEFRLPPGTFVDIDAGDRLAYAASLSDGRALPSWLRFDAATQTFSGTPVNTEVGTLQLRVVATDNAGARAFMDFTLVVLDINDAPSANGALGPVEAQSDSEFFFALPEGQFSDPDAGDSLRYTARLADGRPLPSWLRFDQASRVFSGTPRAVDLGNYAVSVVATDLAGASAQSVFLLRVLPGAPEERPAAIFVLPEEQPSAPPSAAVRAEPPAPAAAPAQTATLPAGVADAAPMSRTAGAEGEAAPSVAPEAPLPMRVSQNAVDAVVTATTVRVVSNAPVVAEVQAQVSELRLATVTEMLSDSRLVREMDTMKQQIQEQSELRRNIVASSIAVSAGVSVGYVVWLVRGGVLLSSMLSALPAWQLIDPLPVLASARAGRPKGGARTADAQDKDVERLFDDARSAPAPSANQNDPAVDRPQAASSSSPQEAS